MPVVNSSALEEFQKLTNGPAAVHFWASWCEPCKHMDEVFAALSNDNPSVKFIRVEAENAEDISEKYEVSSVPFFLFFKGAGAAPERLEGADAGAVTKKVQQIASARAAGAPAAGGASAGAGAAGPAQDINARCAALATAAPLMLFMKGSPDAPKCGFSRKVVEALREVGAGFGHFDILTDEAVRQGMKTFGNWPTYPQLYAQGELIGGCDIILEMKESGELKKTLDEALAVSGAAGKDPVRARIEALLASAPVMLFMKGSPDEPKCGFSRRVVDAIRETGVPFSTFDILTDEAIRQGLKTYSDWPTYPQLYVGRELLGGCDIVMEMKEKGELKQALQPAEPMAA